MRYAITIGTYDGVHLGHQKVFSILTNYSFIHNLKTVVIYFPIPPRLCILKRQLNNLITLPQEREKIIYENKIDIVESVDFTEKIRNLSASRFFYDYVIRKYKPKFIVVGKDFSVGYNREGNNKWLVDFCIENSIDLQIIDFIKYNQHKVSSSLIRSFLHKGNIRDANICLGRMYSLSGIVVKGAGVGKKIGFPTANLKTDPLKITPRGVYAVKIYLQNKSYSGVASIGTRPTLKTLNNALICEVHIFDFNKDIYGKNIEIKFVSRIRDEKKFSSAKTLITRIKKDILIAKDILCKFERSEIKI
ncbi:MAG: bifunctional riboflavin kinase/FAD synthetase [Elusimicrobiota bacterium]